MPTNNNWNKAVDNLRFSGNTITASTGNIELVPGSGGIIRSQVDQNSSTTVVSQNATSGTAALASFRATSASNQAEMVAISAGYTTSGPFAANSTLFRGTGSVGTNVVATNGPLSFYTGASNTFAGSINSSNQFWGILTASAASPLHVFSNSTSPSTKTGIGIGQDGNTANYKRGYIEHVTSNGASGYGYMTLGATSDGLGYGSVIINQNGGTMGVGPLTTPVSQLHLNRSAGPSTNTIASTYLHLGAGEALSGTRQMIGFGYTSGGTYIRGGIGWIVESDAGQTLGRIAVMQSSTTSDVSPTEIWSWDRNGNITVANSASVPGSNPSSAFYMYASSGRTYFRGSDGYVRGIPYRLVWETSGGGTVSTTNYNPDFAYSATCSKVNPGQYPYTIATPPFSKYKVNVTPLENLTVAYRVDISSATTFNVYFYNSTTGAALDCTHQIEVIC
jgi:hypothetical protein